MAEIIQAQTLAPAEAVRRAPVSQAPNGVCYAYLGEITLSPSDFERMVAVVPVSIAAALQKKAYYFVPLTVMQD